REDLSVDLPAVAAHAAWMADAGCTAVVALGSLGEGATLALAEKLAVLQACVESVGSRVPVVAGVAALSTAGGGRLAKAAAGPGCRGRVGLPPYVYSHHWAGVEAQRAARPEGRRHA